MGCGDHQTLFLPLALLLLAINFSSIRLANGNVHETVGGARVSGQLACTPNGNPPAIGPFPPVVGATVTVSCNATTNLTGHAITNENGLFNVTLAPLVNVNLNLTVNTSFGFLLPDCFTTVRLPVKGCSLLPRVGVLRGPIFSLGVILDEVLGLALFFLTGEFRFSPR
ncbi:hypothetical protein ACH5RR_000757 [Cinchona calisaya]|uniref:Pollen Ole e 1 allergen and extensin family protein n=1 Tax=Cinchona calisaya TaxID=153742 RepID=A0ABD3B1Q9_9GENT